MLLIGIDKQSIIVCLIAMLMNTSAKAQTIPARARICGDWEYSEKTLKIRISLDGNVFKARIIWFSDTDGKPMDYWRDVKNPDPALRKRKILGMNILTGLRYDKSSNSWENGIVYDSRHGRYWNAAAHIDKHGLLHIRGYWHFKWIGKTMVFHRIR